MQSILAFGAVIGAFVGVAALVLVLAILMFMWRTWWLYPAWDWFLVPLGLPPISFWHLAALMAFWSALPQNHETKKDDKATDWSKVIGVFLLPPFAWFVLWFIHSYQS